MTDENLSPVAIEAEPVAPKWSDNIEYASFYARLAAFIVDFMVVLIPLFTVMEYIAPYLIGAEHLSRSNMSSLVQSQGGAALATVAAQRIKEYAICGVAAGFIWLACWYYFSATPGKLIFRISIVDEHTGMPPTLKQYIVRYLGLILSGAVVGMGFLWMQWNKRRRAWHDMMAGTIVVKKSSLPELQATATLAKVQES